MHESKLKINLQSNGITAVKKFRLEEKIFFLLEENGVKSTTDDMHVGTCTFQLDR